MDWHYVVNGEQKGPVAEDEFQRLVTESVIGPETLVWKPGMTDWRQFGEFSVEPWAVCAECGRSYPEANMIRFAGHLICPACKPVFDQKLREGVAIGREMRYAGFWIRFVAVLIDLIILELVELPFNIQDYKLIGTDKDPGFGFGIGDIISLLFGATYYIFFLGRFGATLGKMILKLKIVRADGEPIRYRTAVFRYFATFLSAFILCIGYIMAGFDSQKRALHDRLCHTRVIRK